MFIALAMSAWQGLRLRRKLREGEYKFCVGCGYDLGACEESGACPECGRDYTAAGLRKEWKSFLKRGS